MLVLGIYLLIYTRSIYIPVYICQNTEMRKTFINSETRALVDNIVYLSFFTITIFAAAAHGLLSK
jgi:hypothetical protein